MTRLPDPIIRGLATFRCDACGHEEQSIRTPHGWTDRDHGDVWTHVCMVCSAGIHRRPGRVTPLRPIVPEPTQSTLDTRDLLWLLAGLAAVSASVVLVVWFVARVMS